MRLEKEAIRVAVDVEAVYYELLNQTPAKRDSRHLTYLCPFHPDERTPNFKVNTEPGKHRGSGRCFACGASGDLFALWMRLKGVGFQEALTALAERAGLPVNERPRDKPKTAKKSDVSCKLNHDFEKWPKDLKTWLVDRGITPETAKRFNLAHAIYNERWHALAMPYGDLKQDGYVKLQFYRDDYSHKFTTWHSGRPQRLFGLPIEKRVASFCVRAKPTPSGSLKRKLGPASYLSLTVPRPSSLSGQISFKARTWQ